MSKSGEEDELSELRLTGSAESTAAAAAAVLGFLSRSSRTESNMPEISPAFAGFVLGKQWPAFKRNVLKMIEEAEPDVLRVSHWLDGRMEDSAPKFIGTNAAVEKAKAEVQSLVARCGSYLVGVPVDIREDSIGLERALRQLEAKHNVSLGIDKDAKEMPDAMKEALEVSVGHALDVTISGPKGTSLDAAREEAISLAKEFLLHSQKAPTGLLPKAMARRRSRSPRRSPGWWRSGSLRRGSHGRRRDRDRCHSDDSRSRRRSHSRRREWGRTHRSRRRH